MNDQAQTEVSNIELTSNTPAAIQEIGFQAGKKWLSADRANGQGDAMAIKCLFDAWHTSLFVATVKDAKGDIIEQEQFDLADVALRDAPLNDNGKRNTRLMSARMSTVFKDVFGIDSDTITGANKSRFNRALTAARYLAHDCGLEGDEAVTLTKGNLLRVPYGRVVAEPAPDASEKDKITHKAMRDELVTLDGREGLSLAELGKRAKPPVKRGKGNNANADKGKEYASAIAFVTGVTMAFADPSGEKPDQGVPAPNAAMRDKLHTLYVTLGAYFDAEKEAEDAEENDGKQTVNA